MRFGDAPGASGTVTAALIASTAMALCSTDAERGGMRNPRSSRQAPQTHIRCNFRRQQFLSCCGDALVRRRSMRWKW